MVSVVVADRTSGEFSLDYLQKFSSVVIKKVKSPVLSREMSLNRGKDFANGTIEWYKFDLTCIPMPISQTHT